VTYSSQFDSVSLMKAASAACGLSNFGDDHFRAGLDRFVAACRHDGYVLEAGLESIGEVIVKILVNRLRFEDMLLKHPEILDEQIVAPLIIIGPGRVGSTKLHRLLANAENIQITPLWQVMNPVPSNEPVIGNVDPRVRIAEEFCESIKLNVPQLYAAIEPIASAPDEDPYMLDMTFMQLMFLALANVPTYVHWIYQQDWLEPYRYHKKLLQFVQWQNGTSGKPMLLKGPSHTPHMDMLHKLFPDAKFVQIHRDPVTCAASMAKVVWMLHTLRPIKGTDTVRDSAVMQQFYMRHCLLENLRIRDEHPEIPVLDFYYEDVRDRATDLAVKIFEFWGLGLSGASIRRMSAWDDANRQHKLGRFEYTLEESGIDRMQYEASLAPYMKRFFPSAKGASET
jgi:Sulfotransferase family